jgi:hypothetical protein
MLLQKALAFASDRKPQTRPDRAKQYFAQHGFFAKYTFAPPKK